MIIHYYPRYFTVRLWVVIFEQILSSSNKHHHIFSEEVMRLSVDSVIQTQNWFLPVVLASVWRLFGFFCPYRSPLKIDSQRRLQHFRWNTCSPAGAAQLWNELFIFFFFLKANYLSDRRVSAADEVALLLSEGLRHNRRQQVRRRGAALHYLHIWFAVAHKMICIFEWRDFNSTATRRALKKGVEEPAAWKVRTGGGGLAGGGDVSIQVRK